MGGIEDLFTRSEYPAVVASQPVAYACEFAETPGSVAIDAFVYIPGIDDGENKFGPAPWMPRVDDAGMTVQPVAGNVGLVVFDDEGDPWVVAWKVAS